MRRREPSLEINLPINHRRILISVNSANYSKHGHQIPISTHPPPALSQPVPCQSSILHILTPFPLSPIARLQTLATHHPTLAHRRRPAPNHLLPARNATTTLQAPSYTSHPPVPQHPRHLHKIQRRPRLRRRPTRPNINMERSPRTPPGECPVLAPGESIHQCESHAKELEETGQ